MSAIDSPVKKLQRARMTGPKKGSALPTSLARESGTRVMPPETCACAVLHEEQVAAAYAATPPASLLEGLGELFRLFGDPTRLRILSALAAAELCVCDLGEVLGMSQSSVSHQLAQLRAARLVRTRRAGKVVFYSLDDAHVGEILKVGLDHMSERKERS